LVRHVSASVLGHLQAVRGFLCVLFEDRTDSLYRNVSKELPLLAT